MSQKTKYSISAVNRITGKSRTTIAKHLRQGKLSCEVDEHGTKLIDAAELMRVYGTACNFDREKGRGSESDTVQPSQSPDLQRLQEQLDREIAERLREREHSREQVEHLQAALQLAQEGHNRATLLLENQNRGAGDWEQGLKRLEDRLAQQEQRTQAEIKEIRETASKRIAQYKRALEEERGKGFWKRFLG